MVLYLHLHIICILITVTNWLSIYFIFEDENEGFANKEAEYIYDEIFFFTDAETLALPEEQFIEELKKDNREWFE